MIFSKKINLRVIIVLLCFIISIIICDTILLRYTLNKNIEAYCQSESKEIIEQINVELNVLKSLTSKISNNKEIINILENLNDNNINNDLILKINDNIDAFQSVIEALKYTDGIDIISAREKCLISNSLIYKDNDLASKLWYNKDNKNLKEPFLTNVHTDTTNGVFVISVVTYIYSSNGDSILGATIIDINLDKFLEYIDKHVGIGQLKTYIRTDEGEFISRDGMFNKYVTDIEKRKKNKYIIEKINAYNKSNTVIFDFDIDGIEYIKDIKKANYIQCSLLLILWSALMFILMKMLNDVLRPVFQSLDKLKGVIDNLEKSEIITEDKDEVVQLDIIADFIGKSINSKIEALLYYDELTKLPNKKMLIKYCNELIKNNEKFALIFININNFKSVNDVFGHLSGDEILYNFSRRISDAIGTEGMATRYSGDEFIIIYKNFYSERQLREYYNDVLLKEFKAPIYFNNNNKIIIDFSAGVAIYPNDGQVVEELINKSDIMMHNSKEIFEKNHINGLLFFNEGSYEKILKAESLKEELKNAVEKNELVLNYQPLVDGLGKIKKVEALIR